MAHIKHTEEEKKAKAKRICDVYGLGENDLESICASESITEPTFRNWTYDNLEILELYKDARERNNNARKGRLREIALSSLAKAIKDSIHEETTTEYKESKTGKFDEKTGEPIMKPKIVKKVTKVVTVKANPTLIMFALNNTNLLTDPNFVNSRQLDVTSGGEKLRQLPDWLQDLKPSDEKTE